MSGFEVGSAESAKGILGQRLIDILLLLVGEVGVLIELCLKALNFFEALDELGAGIVALEVGDGLWRRFKALRCEEVVEVDLGLFELLDDFRSLIDQPYLAGGACLGTGEQGDSFIDVGLLATEVKDVAVGFGVVEDAIGTAKGLDEAVVLEFLST